MLTPRMGSLRQFPLPCYCFSWQTTKIWRATAESQYFGKAFHRAWIKGTLEIFDLNAVRGRLSHFLKNEKSKHFVSPVTTYSQYEYTEMLSYGKTRLETLDFWKLFYSIVLENVPDCPQEVTVQHSLYHSKVYFMILTLFILSFNAPSWLTGS